MTQQQEERPITFSIVEINGRFTRVLDPEIVEVSDPKLVIIDQENILRLDPDTQARIYGRVAGTSPKIFKTPRALLESLEYQAQKLPVYGAKETLKEKFDEDPSIGGGEKKERSAKSTRGPRKSALNVVHLQVPNDRDQLFNKLPSQAKALITLMTELAGELKTTDLPGQSVIEKISQPRSIEMMSNTTQPPLRILAYYASRLISEGWIRIS